MIALASAVLSRTWTYLLCAAVGAGAVWYIEGLRLDAVRADLRAAAAAVHAAQADAAAAEKRADDLARQKPASADQCAAVDAFTLDYLRGRQ